MEPTRLHNRGPPQGGTRTYQPPRRHVHSPRSHPKLRSDRRATPRGRGKERRAPWPTYPRQPVGGGTDRSPSPHDCPTPRGRREGRRAPGPTHPRQQVGGTTDRSPSPHDCPTPRGRGEGRRAPGPTHPRQPVGRTTDRSLSIHDSPRSGSVRARARRSPQDHRPATTVDPAGDEVPSFFRIQARRTIHLQQRGHVTRQNSKNPQHPRAGRATSALRRAGREGIPHSPRCLHLPPPGTPDRAGRRQLPDPLPVDRVGTGKGRHFARRDRGAPPRTRHADRLVADTGPGASPRCRLHGHGTRSFLRLTGPTRGGVEKRRLPSGSQL